MKEITGKTKFKINKLPHTIVIDEKEKDFSKVFDTVDYKILIRKLEKYGIKHQCIDWFKSYLNSWKQYVGYSEEKAPLEEVKCGARESSILGSLLSLIFFTDLQHAKKFLNPIMFAVDTTYSNQIVM